MNMVYLPSDNAFVRNFHEIPFILHKTAINNKISTLQVCIIEIILIYCQVKGNKSVRHREYSNAIY